MTEEKDIYTNYYYCPHCYVNFSEKSDDLDLITDRKKLCDFCTLHPTYIEHYHHSKLAQRMIDVLPRTNVNDFPKIMQFILNQVKWRDEQ